MLFSQAEFAAAIAAGVYWPAFFFNVPAKLKAHGGKYFAGKIVLAARSETLIERCGEHRSRCCGFDRR